MTTLTLPKDDKIILTRHGQTPWPHFSYAELACKCGCGVMSMSASFMDMLEKLRVVHGSALKITSAYRCPTHNAKESKTGTTGVHTIGKAVDIAIAGQEASNLLRLAIKMDFSGIGIKQHGSGRYIHLDMATEADGFPRPIVWTYP